MVQKADRVRTRTMENTRATVKEIARLAGVSIGTVDRVLHDRGEVSADTKAKILTIVAALGYEPNILARQLARNRVYTLRAILPRADQDSGYWSLCLAGIHRAERDLAPYGTSLRVDEFDRYDRAGYRALLRDVVAEPRDGLLIAPVLPDDLVPVLKKLNAASPPGRAGGLVPYVFFDCDAEGASPVAAIGQDARRAGYLAGRMMSLLAKRPGPLVAVSAHAGDRHIRLRIEGFETFFRDVVPGTESRTVIVKECPEARRRRGLRARPGKELSLQSRYRGDPGRQFLGPRRGRMAGRARRQGKLRRRLLGLGAGQRAGPPRGQDRLRRFPATRRAGARGAREAFQGGRSRAVGRVARVNPP